MTKIALLWIENWADWKENGRRRNGHSCEIVTLLSQMQCKYKPDWTMTKIAMLWIEEEKLSRLKRKWKEEKRSQLWNSDLAPPNAVLCPLGGLDTKGLIWPDQCPQFSQKCEAQWDWYDRNKISLIFQMSSELLFASPEDDVPEVLLDTWYSRMCPRCTIWDSQNLSVCARYQMKKVWLWKHLSQGWGRDNGFLVCSLMGWLTIWCCCAPGSQEAWCAFMAKSWSNTQETEWMK